MNDQTKPEFDPRFSPAFQRGFDPAQTDTQEPIAPSTTQAPPRSLISTPPQVSPARAQPAAPAAAASQPAAPAAAAATESTSVRPPSSRHLQTEPVLLDAPGGDPFDLPSAGSNPAEFTPADHSGRNPFLIVLGVLSIALVVLGCWLFLRAGAAFNSREVRSQGDFNSLSATITAAPFVVLLGVATAIAMLFVFALRWRRSAAKSRRNDE